jgi:multidrug efflux pump subunit AcrA (membrane-fusion protein)
VKTLVSGYGTLERLDGVAQLRAPVTGTLASLLVNVDDYVTPGQVVASVLPADPGAVLVPLASPIAGRVLQIYAAPGQGVAEAQELLSVEDPQQPLSAVLYVAAQEAYQIKADMEAKVLPATFSKHQGAYLVGRVARAGRHPVSVQQRAAWQTEGAARPQLKVVVDFTAGGGARRIESEPGSTAEIYSGTPCQGLITVEERRPISIIFSVP